MALLKITESTTVGDFNNAIQALKNAQNKTDNKAEKDRLQQFINKYSSSRDKLIAICKNDIIRDGLTLDPKTKEEISKLTREGFKELSLEKWNNFLEARKMETHDKKEVQTHSGQWAVDLAEGKTGLTLMTGVKASLAVGAIASMISLKVAESSTIATFLSGLGIEGLVTAGAAGTANISIIQIIPAIIGPLFAANPFLGAAAVGLLGFGAIKLGKKIFGPEIKKLWSSFKVKRDARLSSGSAKMEIEAGQDIDKILAEKEAAYNKALAEKSESEKITPSTPGETPYYENEFRKKAFDILKKVKQEEWPGKIKQLMEAYAGKVENREEILREVGLPLGDPNLRPILEALQGEEHSPFIDTKKPGIANSQSRQDFNDFKKAYKETIKLIVENTDSKNSQKIANKLARLSHQLKEGSMFLDGSTTADKERQTKLIQLCEGMLEILHELHRAEDLDRTKSEKTIREEIEKKHNLDAGQLDNL